MSTDVSATLNPSASQAERQTARAAVLHASCLLNDDRGSETIDAILATTGAALAVDRVLVIENKHSVSPQICHFWQRTGVPPLPGNLLDGFPAKASGPLDWIQPLTEGRHVTADASTAAGPVADQLRRCHLQSILIVPIILDGRFWGSIGVDACFAERQWTDLEIDLLKILANLIGAKILRDRDIRVLHASEQKFRALAEAALDGIIVLDGAGCVQYWNPAATRILGYSSDEALGQDLHSWIVPPRDRDSAQAAMQRFHQMGEVRHLGATTECLALHRDGSEVPIELSVAPVHLDGSWCAVGVLRDISARNESQKRLAWLASNDPLTGLPNRTVFVSQLAQAIERRARLNQHFAVFYLDLDHFKDVNDTLGHPVGDRLLRQVAERLRASIRDIDLAARFGGDEFAVLVNRLHSPDYAEVLASRLAESLAQPYSLSGVLLRSSATIGIAVSDQNGSTAEEVLAQADMALYRAKSEGRGTWHRFTDKLHEDVRRRVALLRDLRSGLEHNEFRVFYQPQVNLATGAILGLEALVRWRRPQRGWVCPGEFIGAAENGGLIVPLGKLVLHSACSQGRAWLDRGIDIPALAVNVSPLQLRNAARFADDLLQILAETGFPSHLLEIEITESALMQLSQSSGEVLEHLRSLGIQIAIDDFGTGYSCLERLGHLPVSRIKIAQPFVARIACSDNNATVVRAIIGLGRELGLAVLAEGVEQPQQVELLRRWGCQEGQGFYFARPMPARAAAHALLAGICPDRGFRSTLAPEVSPEKEVILSSR